MAGRTTFSTGGLNIGNNDRNLTYLYGLSDFWVFIFEDKEKIELLLEASSTKLSDIYSKFLQLTSTVSIADIEIATHQQLKLILLKTTDAVDGKINTYTLPETILESRVIANRPLLPTAYLENEVHYRISSDGTEIQFFEPLNDIGFPSRIDSDGVKEYALWMVDTVVDEQAIYNHFGKLIGVDPQTSTENYKNFVYGLYYLFVNGPNLALLRKGLNLALGIPLARETETVLDIRLYPDTNQYVVTTDLNSYLIPFGLQPSVAVGDVLEATSSLAEWIEVKDWINDGEWWINLAIPPALMPHIPPTEIDRFAKEGSYADYIMRNFLKNHTFLVNVKTIDFKNIQTFEELSAIITKAKPTYTFPIYIWTVPIDDELMNISDGDFFLRWDQFRCENISVPIHKFIRNYSFPTDITGDKHIDFTVNGNTQEVIPTSYSSGRANLPLVKPTYWEIDIDRIHVGGEVSIGISTSATALNVAPGSVATAWVYRNTGHKVNNNVATAYGLPYTNKDIIGIKYDPTEGSVEFFKNGLSQGVAYTGILDAVYPIVGLQGGTLKSTKTVSNFGVKAFELFGENKIYLSLPGTAGNYVRSNDVPDLDLDGNIDLRARITAPDWTPAADSAILAKWVETGNQRGYEFKLTTTGALAMCISGTGTDSFCVTSDAIPSFINGYTYWVRVTRVKSNGDTKFYTSNDGVIWMQLGSTIVNSSGTGIFNSTSPLEIGSTDLGTAKSLAAKIHYADVRYDLDDLPMSIFYPRSDAKPGQTSFVSSAGETWLVQQSGTPKAEIKSDSLSNFSSNKVYLYLPGSSGNYASTPDYPQVSVTGDIDLRARVKLSDWTPSAQQTLLSKWGTSGQQSYYFSIETSGVLRLAVSTTGSDTLTWDSSVGTGFTNGTLNWVRAVRIAATGDTTFYTSSNGSEWIQLGTPVSGTIGNIFDSTSAVWIGAKTGTTPSIGKIYFAEIRNGNNGATVSRFDPNNKAVEGATSFISSYGETWTINQSGANTAKLSTDNVNLGLYTNGEHLLRGCPQFMRRSISDYTSGQVGNSEQINGTGRIFEEGLVGGFINQMGHLRTNTTNEIGWLNSLFDRSVDSDNKHRSKVAFTRNILNYDGSGDGSRPDILFPVLDTHRMIFLYNTTQTHVASMFTTVGQAVPGMNEWVFRLFLPKRVGTAINESQINKDFIDHDYSPFLQSQFNSFFIRDSYRYLGNFMPTGGYQFYQPNPLDILPGDYLLFIRVYENTVSVYWITTNVNVVVNQLLVEERTDQWGVYSNTSTLNRSFGPYSPYYMLRGQGGNLDHTLQGINAEYINEELGPTISVPVSSDYSDAYNVPPVAIDRSGKVLKFRRDFK